MLDFIILFISSFFFTQSFVYVSTSTFERTLYPVYFLLLLIYLLLSLEQPDNKKFQIRIDRLKYLTFILIALLTVFKTFYSAINLRHELGFTYHVHDNPVQIEEAIKFLKNGQNPYSENYHDTALGEWFGKDNRLGVSLYHVVTLPFYLLFSLLTSYPCEFIFGYFDERIVHLISLFISLFLIHKLVKPVKQKIIYLSLFLFNPIFIHYFIEGRNDIFVFSWIFLSIYFLYKKKITLSSIFLAFAFTSKQSAWLILPFYFYFIYLKQDKNFKFIQKIKNILTNTCPFFLLSALFFLPFLIWDAKAFIDDIYRYPGGGLPTSYFITGFGVSFILLQKGIIATDTSYFPFWILQLIFAIPLMIYILIKMKKNISIYYLTFSYLSFLLVFWLFSRFFNENYVGYLSMLAIIGGIFYQDIKVIVNFENKKNLKK